MAVFEFDAYSPQQIAEQIEAVGVVKARLPLLAMFMLGILLSAGAPVGVAVPDWWGLVSNLVPVTLGNIAGGSIMVAAVYHLIYGRALKKGSWRP